MREVPTGLVPIMVVMVCYINCYGMGQQLAFLVFYSVTA